MPESNDEARERELAEVLWRFEQAHPLPDGDDVERWTAEHPRFADEILEYATAKAQLFLAPDDEADEADDEEDACLAADELMAALYPSDDAPDLVTLMDRAGMDVDQMAERLGIRVVVLERAATGQVRGPVPTEIVRRLAEELDHGLLIVVRALNASAARPRLGHASAVGDAVPFPTYDELIAASDMGEERKAYWLSDR